MTPRALPILALCTALMGCGGPELRVAVPDSTTELRSASRYASLEVVEIGLPTHAADEKIYVQAPDGTLSPTGALWADDPARAMTLQLARDLDRITGARVAPEPWPFRDFASAKVDVRLTDLHATADGQFRLKGQYFVAPDQGGGGRSGQFAISVPVTQADSAGAIAAARAVAVTRLAEDIARKAL